MLRFISKLNDDLKDRLFILCSATSRYLATITSRVIHFLNFLGKNLPIGAPIEIYRRRRRVEFIGGGGVPAAAPTSDACKLHFWMHERKLLLCEYIDNKYQ